MNNFCGAATHQLVAKKILCEAIYHSQFNKINHSFFHQIHQQFHLKTDEYSMHSKRLSLQNTQFNFNPEKSFMNSLKEK
jgi:hypothetical protein